MQTRNKYYWDSCIFIAWITNEKRGPGESEGIERIAKEISDNKADLFTSVFTRTEVLEGKMTPEQQELFKKLFQRRNVLAIDISERILDKSKEIREWNSKISSADAIHLATAIVYDATEFHTTDGAAKKKRGGHLLPLNGNVNGYPLKILTPVATQRSLFAGVGSTMIGKPAKKGK